MSLHIWTQEVKGHYLDHHSFANECERLYLATLKHVMQSVCSGLLICRARNWWKVFSFQRLEKMFCQRFDANFNCKIIEQCNLSYLKNNGYTIEDAAELSGSINSASCVYDNAVYIIRRISKIFSTLQEISKYTQQSNTMKIVVLRCISPVSLRVQCS